MSTLKVGELFRDLATKELKGRFKEYSDVVMCNFSKLKSAQMSQLRKELKTVDARMLVVKNSFLTHVMQDLKMNPELMTLVDGALALIFSKKDIILTSKVLAHFAKEYEALQLKGGILSDRLLSSAEIKFLAKLSSQKAVYQQVAGVLNAPMRKLAMSLNQVLSKLVYVLGALKDKKK